MDFENREERFSAFVEQIGQLLGYSTRSVLFAAYLVGLMSSLARKTAEGIATLFADEQTAQAMHQRLQQFIADSPWKDQPVRRYVFNYAMASLSDDEPISYWIVDDTGFIKQGVHSVGVHRQYTGTSGKIDNCQIAVSLGVATPQRQQPVDFRLYIPETWTDDSARRAGAKIPSDLTFKTKPELAAEMINGAVFSGVPKGVVLADCAYGNNRGFRRTLRANRLDYSVDILGSTSMWRLDADDKRRGRVSRAESIGRRLEFRRCTWTEGTKRELASRFAFARVAVRNDADEGVPNPVWLGVELPYDEEEEVSYFISTLPRDSTIVDRVRTHKSRWRTERMYQDLKGVFGLDHYEGRSYPGWHHHATMAMAAYSFAFAEQARLFVRPRGRPSSTVKVRVGGCHDSVAASDCATARWGGKQLKANDRSVGQRTRFGGYLWRAYEKMAKPENHRAR